MNSRVWVECLLISSLAHFAEAASWDPAAAAGYLDKREAWWQSWPRAQRDHDTTCISCHSVLPYAIGRPALRARLNDDKPAAPERTMLAYIEKRVSPCGSSCPSFQLHNQQLTQSSALLPNFEKSVVAEWRDE